MCRVTSRTVVIAAADRGSATRAESTIDLHDDLDLDRDVEWQLGHPDGRAGTSAGLAEHLDEQLRPAIDDLRGRMKPGAQFTIPSTLTRRVSRRRGSRARLAARRGAAVRRAALRDGPHRRRDHVRPCRPRRCRPGGRDRHPTGTAGHPFAPPGRTSRPAPTASSVRFRARSVVRRPSRPPSVNPQRSTKDQVVTAGATRRRPQDRLRASRPGSSRG